MAFYAGCLKQLHGTSDRAQKIHTLIRLAAVQAQLFHNRQQQEKETVDPFAQELQKLYNLAYAGATSEEPQAEHMGQTLLTNQFVTGLRPHITGRRATTATTTSTTTPQPTVSALVCEEDPLEKLDRVHGFSWFCWFMGSLVLPVH